MAEYNPGSKSRFKIQIDGIDYGNFISVSGINATSEVTEDIGGMDKTGRKITGKVKYDTVSMTRNCDPSDKALRDWWKTVEDGKPQKKNVSIMLLDPHSGDSKAQRDFQNCIPCGYSISDLNSQDNSPLTESISIAFTDAKWG
jgi:phage tail-like protein